MNFQVHGPITTGFGQFAWCLKHQAKAKKHPTKNLPGATPGKKRPGKEIFAGCFLSGTRQIFCLVFFPAPGKKSYRHGVSVSWFFCRVPGWRHPANIYIHFFDSILCQVSSEVGTGK